MSKYDRSILSLVLARWGFAVLVGMAIVVGLLVAATVNVPDAVPSVALRAVPVYRVEVGAAVFFGFISPPWFSRLLCTTESSPRSAEAD